MIVTLAIFAILVAIAVPNFVAFQPGQRLNGAAREVLVKLRWARAQAVEQNSPYVMTFPNNHTVQIFNDANGNNTPDAGEWSQTIDIQTDYVDVTFSVSGSTPRFDGRGTAPDGSTMITLSNSSGSKQVEVKPTGEVNII